MHRKLLLLLMYYVDLFFDKSLECPYSEVIKFLDFPFFLHIIICSFHYVLLIDIFSLIILHIILIVIRVVNRLRHAFLGNGDRAIHIKTILLMTSSHCFFIRSHN
jgi:hypothetical protein